MILWWRNKRLLHGAKTHKKGKLDKLYKKIVKTEPEMAMKKVQRIGGKNEAVQHCGEDTTTNKVTTER